MKHLNYYPAVLLAWLIVIPVQLKAGNPIDKEFNRNIISFNLATPFDPSFPRLRLGYTYVATGSFSQTFELGYGSRKLFPDSTFYTHNTLHTNYRLWEMRTESRYYFAGMRKYVIPYAAFEMYYIRHRQTMLNSSFAPSGEDNLEIRYERADYLRTKAGFNMKTGIIFRMGPLMAVELYGGFGLRMRNNRYTNVDIIDTGFGPGWFDDWNYYYHEGIRWNLNLTSGIKLNFMF